MSKHPIIPVLVAAAMAISGCASNKGGYRTEAAVERKLLTMTREDVLIDLGEPASKSKLSNGAEAWRYNSEVGGLTGGECTLSLVLSGERVTQAKLSANDLSWVSWPLGSCSKIIQTLRR